VPAAPRRRPGYIVETGFSLVELMMVAAIGSILLAITTVSIGYILDSTRGDAALAGVTSQLRRARDLAINRRRTIQVDFVAPNEVRTTQLDIPSGTTLINQFFLEGSVQFVQFAIVPDTPDGFGASSAIDFGNETPYFVVDGMLVDGAGAPLSGTVFMGLQDVPSSARAVSVFGGTGHVRGYSWNGTAWVEQ
jgi:prepilin-type N-terminal cleavage/methylation domain-containing protein